MGRLTTAVDRHGILGTARAAAHMVRDAAHQDETSTWFEVLLDQNRPRVAAAQGDLVLAADDDTFELFNAIGSQSAGVARDRRSAGGEPWVLLVDGKPAFCCWLYAGRSPINSMAGEWLHLPPAVRTLEDSITAPDFRGRGLAGGVWMALFDDLERQGVRSVVTNVLDTNVPSTKAVLKVGFAPVASMRYVRVGPWSRQYLTPLAAGSGPAIVADLHHRTHWRR